jgi:ribokinase
MTSRSAKSPPRVTVVGTLNLDRVWRVPVLPQPGRTIIATATERQFGGKGANQAVAAARLGARVRMIGSVGDDADGEDYRAHLQAEGIDVSLLAVVRAVPTGTAHVYVEPNGENLIVVDRGANAHIPPLEGCREVLAGSDIVLVQLECELSTAVEALRLAAEHRVQTVLNASPSSAQFPWGADAIDVVIVNEHECFECFSQTPAALWAQPDQARIEFLSARKIRNLVITQGAQPTLHLSGLVRYATPTLAVTPRDTVGAGDTFAGALVAQLAAGEAWAVALWRANVAAALSTLSIGAQSAMPRRAALEDAIARTNTSLPATD